MDNLINIKGLINIINEYLYTSHPYINEFYDKTKMLKEDLSKDENYVRHIVKMRDLSWGIWVEWEWDW